MLQFDWPMLFVIIVSLNIEEGTETRRNETMTSANQIERR